MGDIPKSVPPEKKGYRVLTAVKPFLSVASAISYLRELALAPLLLRYLLSNILMMMLLMTNDVMVVNGSTTGR